MKFHEPVRMLTHLIVEVTVGNLLLTLKTVALSVCYLKYLITTQRDHGDHAYFNYISKCNINQLK